MALSTALCLPISSRTTSSSPVGEKIAAACNPPVRKKTACVSRNFGGNWQSIEPRSSLGTAQASQPELRDGRIPAHAACRDRGKSVRRAIRRESHAGIEGHANEIFLRRGVSWHSQRHQGFPAGDDAFGKEKTSHEVFLVHRRPRSDAQGISSCAHLPRGFRCHVVLHTRCF